MTAIPLDFNIGLVDYALLNEANIAGGRRAAIISFFDPTGGLPASPAQYDSYISSATANGWIINDIFYWNGITWVRVIPPIGDIVFVKGGATYPEQVVAWEGLPAGWQPVFQGAVVGHGRDPVGQGDRGGAFQG